VEEFSKRTFLRNVIDSGGFTKEQLSLLYDRYYSVLFYAGILGSPAGGAPPSRKKEGEASAAKIALDVYAFARFMYEISSWMRVQIKEARERTQNHRNVSLADTRRSNKSPASSATAGLAGGRDGAKAKGDDVARETTASLENPGWFITSLFRYASCIVPPVSRLHAFDASESDISAPREANSTSSTDSPGGVTDDTTASSKPVDEPVGPSDNDSMAVESLRVSFQQCVIALGRIVNTDMLTRMDVFFDMYAMTTAGAITRKEMFQLSEAILYIGHGEDIETTGRRHERPDKDITNEERLLRSVSEFLRRAVAYGEKEKEKENAQQQGSGVSSDFMLPRNMFRVVVLEDEMLEQFFSQMVPASFRFTDGVELSNPLRAISTHLPLSSPPPVSSPTSPRFADGSASARILAGGRLVAEEMSARVAQTIALGSQFVDQRVLAPIVRGAALSETSLAASDGLAKETVLSNSEPQLLGLATSFSDQMADDMARMSLGGNDHDDDGPPLQQRNDVPGGGGAVPSDDGLWVNAPQDPYENLLDEVDQLLGEIKDDDESAASAAVASSAGDFAANRKAKLDLHMDDDLDEDIDDDLARLLKD
ncbi:hypothetical protein GGI21_004503, partial [Coemansia aciculifera]